jgi:hypothetical protein
MKGHRLQVYVNRGHQGRCECGWRGPRRPRAAEAWDDARMHRLEAQYGP